MANDVIQWRKSCRGLLVSRLAPSAAGWALVLLSGLTCKVSLAAEDMPPNAQRGRLLLAQYQCGSCHVIPGVAAARGTLGPTLQGFGRRSYITGEVPNRTESLVRWIVQPRALVPDTTMPSMGVSVEDARHMAAFLHGLR
jgi:cytochrome c2